jgi:hypothetical protein
VVQVVVVLNGKGSRMVEVDRLNKNIVVDELVASHGDHVALNV